MPRCSIDPSTGRALLPHAKRSLTDVARYRVHGKAMAAGVEAEVRIMLPDVMPREALVAALTTFRSHYPSVQVRITTESGAQALRQLDAGKTDLAVALDHIGLPDWFDRKPSTRIQLVVVASPDHPLTAALAPTRPEVLADHLQVVVASRSVEDDGAPRCQAAKFSSSDY